MEIHSHLKNVSVLITQTHTQSPRDLSDQRDGQFRGPPGAQFRSDAVRYGPMRYLVILDTPGRAPGYLADDCCSSGKRHPGRESVDSHKLHVCRTQHSVTVASSPNHTVES